VSGEHRLFLADDADEQATLWGFDIDRPDEPVALLRRIELPYLWRDAVWDALTFAIEGHPRGCCDPS
jgi:hypothetical protein